MTLEEDVRAIFVPTRWFLTLDILIDPRIAERNSHARANKVIKLLKRMVRDEVLEHRYWSKELGTFVNVPPGTLLSAGAGLESAYRLMTPSRPEVPAEIHNIVAFPTGEITEPRS